MSEAESNIYQAPESELIESQNDGQTHILATRMSRFGASLIDSLIMGVFIFAALFAFGWFKVLSEGDELTFFENLVTSIVGIASFFIINYKFLANDGQTLGKKAVGIKVVAEDGSPALMSEHFLKRYAVYFIPNQIPVVGGVFQIANVLFIFRESRKCFHDDVAKTKVVVA